MNRPDSDSGVGPQAASGLSPSHRLDQRLRARLDQLDKNNLRRSLRTLPSAGKYVQVDGQPLLNLAGNDYLALADHPHLKEAAIAAIQQHGTGSGASRLVAGHLDIHEQVERQFAEFKHAEAALLFPTGYAANLGVIGALVEGPADLICQDKLNHASLIDAAQLSGATVRTFPHRDAVKLDRLLARHREQSPEAQRFVVTDSVFSMDGDTADLPTLCEVCERHYAVLIVDEAHGTGVLGEDGSGLAAAQGVVGRVPVVISTASKALGGLGGMVTGSRAVIDALVNRARPLIYTTAIPPGQAAAIGAAVQVIRREPWRQKHLGDLSRIARQRFSASGWPGLEQELATPILPLLVGDAAEALEVALNLQAKGIFAVAIRPPTVARGAARVRLSLRADLDGADLDRVVAAVGPGPGGKL